MQCSLKRTQGWKILALWIHQGFCHFSKARIWLKCLLVHKWSCFFRDATLRDDVALHMLCSMSIWSPYSVSSPLPEGQSGLRLWGRVRWTQESIPDKITNQKYLLLKRSVSNSVWGKETDLKQSLFSPCIFKTRRQKCSNDFKGIRLHFNKKLNRKTHAESITVEQSCDLPATFHVNSMREILFGWKSRAYLLVTLGGLSLGPSCCRRADWRTMPSLSTISYYPEHLPSALLWETSSPVLLCLLHLFHLTLSCCFCLPQVVPKLLFSSTRGSRLFLLPFRFRKSLLPISSLLMFLWIGD